MGYRYLQEVQQDSTAVKTPQEGINLKLDRSTIEITSLREIRIDSTRLIKKKRTIPIVKTKPFVPINDTIPQPVYNVINGKFFFPQQHSFFEECYFTPVAPDYKSDFKKTIAKNESTDIVVEKTNNNDVIAITEIVKPEIKIREKGFTSTDWMLGVIIFSLLLFAWIKVGFSRFYKSAIQASYNYFTARKIFTEVNVTQNRVFAFINLLFYVNISLFISQFINYSGIEVSGLSGIGLFAVVFATVFNIYIVKFLFLYILDFILLSRGGFSNYVFTVSLYNKMAGILLLPIVSILPFVPDNVVFPLFIAGGLVLILMYILRILRGLQIGFKKYVSIFYLILYLCALEILPVLVLLKIVSNYLN